MTKEDVIQRAIEQWAILAFAADPPSEYPSLAHYIAASLFEHDQAGRRRFINGG